MLGFKDPSSIARLVAEGKLTPSRQLPGKTGPRLFWRKDILALKKQRAEAVVAQALGRVTARVSSARRRSWTPHSRLAIPTSSSTRRRA